MPVVGQRDPDQTREVLTTWLAAQLPDATDVAITSLEVPQATGYSNETFLFDASWRRGGRVERAELVLRSQPQVYALFPEIDLITQQYRTMRVLGERTDVPVARMRWAEPDPSVLGQPFFVMDRLHGRVPGDTPPYTVEGWVMDLTPAQRRRMHRNGIEAMAHINRVDWRALGLHYLDKAHHGPLGPEQRRNYFGSFWEWARGGHPHPVADPVWGWLEANWPDDGDHVELCWGDARPGNQMFDDQGEVVGIFDWEMVALANAESDLGWWLFLQRFHTDGTGVALPEGMLSRDETIEVWERSVGRRAEHVDFYERLAGFHFTLVMMRIGQMMERFAPGTRPPGFDSQNPVARLTCELIGLDEANPAGA